MTDNMPDTTESEPSPSIPETETTPTSSMTADAPSSTNIETAPSAPVSTTVNPLACTALQKLYTTLNGNAWVVKTGWDSTDMNTCCNWYNVHCNSFGQVLKV